MLCPVCQKFNPDNNSFCGDCGHPLASNQMPSNYPREGFDEVAEPEIHQIDPRIPANEYTRPRVTARKESQEPAESSLPRALRANDTPRAEKPAQPSTTPTPRSSTSIFGLDDMEPPKFETDPYSVRPVSNSMFDFDPAAAERSSQSIHGPSFLGLSDPDFLDDEEEPSHRRRNWLLVALVVVIVIGVVQWRNIRDTGLQYAGTLHFNFPLKKGSGQAQIAPEKAAPIESTENSAASEGKPEIDVNPTANGASSGTNPGSADQSKSGEENLLTAQSGAKSVTPSDSRDNSPKATSSDTQSQSSTSTSSKNADQAAAPANDSGKNSTAKSNDASDHTSEVADARPPKTKAERAARAKRNSASDNPSPKPVPGADDLAHAYSASDPATAANWLWAATKKGNKEAPVLLADYYAKGRGVPKDCEQATVLLHSAARNGNPRASARLGMFYAVGECVPQDRAQAWHWLLLAHQSDPSSDWVEQYRRQLWSQMTPDERARSGSGPRASE